MYNNIADIDREIAALEEDRDYHILYWFETGELDCEVSLQPQYLDNSWYMMGYHDRQHQIEIGFNYQPQRFEHF